MGAVFKVSKAHNIPVGSLSACGCCLIMEALVTASVPCLPAAMPPAMVITP